MSSSASGQLTIDRPDKPRVFMHRDGRWRPGGKWANDIRLFTNQGQQPRVVVATSWLPVGHADETMHVLRADNERGWTLMVADPRLAERQLRARPVGGAGASRLFEGTSARHQPSVAEPADGEFLAGNGQAARHIDGQVETMLAETGLRADAPVRVPCWFHRPPEIPPFMALSSGRIPNGLSVDARHLAAPGPRVGPDVFRSPNARCGTASA